MNKTGAIIQNITLLIFKTLKILTIYLCKGSLNTLNKLPKIIHKVIFNYINKATS